MYHFDKESATHPGTPVLEGIVTRKWTLMAHVRDLGEPYPWLGAHDKPGTRETNPHWTE